MYHLGQIFFFIFLSLFSHLQKTNNTLKDGTNLNNTLELSAESGTNEVFFKERYYQDFPGDPVVKNLPANSRDTGLIFDLERLPHVSGQLSLCANNC